MFFYFCIHGVDQLYTAIGALEQPVVNIRAAIAAFGFIILWGKRNAGGHDEIVSKKGTSGTQQDPP
jgi:hypothetical protein